MTAKGRIHACLFPDKAWIFRGFDRNVPDLWRCNEWNREFRACAANGLLPGLETVRFSHDHIGGPGTAQAGMVGPEQEQADQRRASTPAFRPSHRGTCIVRPRPSPQPAGRCITPSRQPPAASHSYGHIGHT